MNISASQGSNGDLMPLAPLTFESPIGQFLAEILQTHPHLLMPAADQQLENLQAESDAAREKNVAGDLLYKYVLFVKICLLYACNPSRKPRIVLFFQFA